MSAIQRELENTDKHDWHWVIKQQSGVLGTQASTSEDRALVVGSPRINMTSHMKLPLPTRNFPKSTDTTPRSLRSPGGQSPCEAYFNGGMGLSPMSAYFEGPQCFFGGTPGPAGAESANTMMQPTSPHAPTSPVASDSRAPATQPPSKAPSAQPQNTNQMQMGVQHTMPFVTYPTTQGMPWPAVQSGAPNLSIPTSGPTLLQGAAASVQKAVVPPKQPMQQTTGRRVETRSPTSTRSCPAAVYVDLSSLREKK